MLEVAIVSIKCALRDEYEEFREFYESRGWIKESPDTATNSESEAVTEEINGDTVKNTEADESDTDGDKE